MTSPSLAMFYRLSSGDLVRLDAIIATCPCDWIDGVVVGWHLLLSSGAKAYVNAGDLAAVVELIEQRMGVV